jgi:predicted nucleic acid-binding protein
MIQVVADATLLRYLIEIQAIDVLPGLFGRIITPLWVVVQAPSSAPDPALSHLGAGEREAILLAYEHPPALLVTDDCRAWRIAEAHGLRVVGTVWVLERAAERGLVDLPPTLTLLLTTNIRLHPDVIQNALARDAARKGR